MRSAEIVCAIRRDHMYYSPRSDALHQRFRKPCFSHSRTAPLSTGFWRCLQAILSEIYKSHRGNSVHGQNSLPEFPSCPWVPSRNRWRLTIVIRRDSLIRVYAVQTFWSLLIVWSGWVVSQYTRQPFPSTSYVRIHLRSHSIFSTCVSEGHGCFSFLE